MSLTKQLQDAIGGSGMSLYRIAKDVEMDYSILHRFAAGERDIQLETAEKLAEFFGMRLTRPLKPKKGDYR